MPRGVGARSMRLIYLAAFPFVLGLLRRPPQLDAVAVGATMALFGGLYVVYRGWELPEEEEERG